ncbi:putative short chain dehydrogenase/reductase [Penicillium brasilianum]|uniref:Putative short chain dehydrogenase/reductase n=1 Tax=Penicillium brasilianum TaxID=104259 RepID=A0A1S9RH03_PENBI|nr:putative short chain dehydrogenase/reductase [Penicillium brasilianum]
MSSKTAIVTGGAAGIGLGIVKYLARASEHGVSHIAVLDVNTATGQDVVASLKDEFPNIDFSFYLCDVTSWEVQAEVFESVYTKQGHIDIVFANAGIAETGFLFQTEGDKPVKPDLKTYDVDLTGAMYTVSLAAFYISKNQSSAENHFKGSIICTASNSGLYPLSLAPIYTTAKHGVVGMVRGLAGRFQHERIRINAIAPCIVETNIGARLRDLPGISFTPLSAVMEAVGKLLSDSELNGKILEISDENITLAEIPAFVDKSTENNLEILGNLAQKIWNGDFGSHGSEE